MANRDELEAAVKAGSDTVVAKRKFRDAEYALKIKPLDEDVERAEQAVTHLEVKLEALEASEWETDDWEGGVQLSHPPTGGTNG